MPFLKDVLINLGYFFPVFAVFVIVGASNAVNLTDGLDGLAIVPIMIATRLAPTSRTASMKITCVAPGAIKPIEKYISAG